MPTFNQLVRKGREVLVHKSTRARSSEKLQLPEEAVHHSEQPAEARRLHCCAYHDPQEAELCSA